MGCQRKCLRQTVQPPWLDYYHHKQLFYDVTSNDVQALRYEDEVWDRKRQHFHHTHFSTRLSRPAFNQATHFSIMVFFFEKLHKPFRGRAIVGLGTKKWLDVSIAYSIHVKTVHFALFFYLEHRVLKNLLYTQPLINNIFASQKSFYSL